MARLDEPTSSDPWIKEKDEKEKLKEEIREEVTRDIKKKKHKKFFTCCLLESLLVVLILGSIAAGLAKTGLVEVPVFSKIFNKPPVPQKVVTVTPEEVKNFSTDITKKVEQEVRSALVPGVTDQKVEINLEFTEKELTALMQNLETNGDLPLKNSQISITPEGLEIFGEINEPRKTYLVINLKPEIRDGDLKIKIQKIKIGTLSLPAIFGNFLVEKLLNAQLDEVRDEIAKVGELKNINLGEGKITLSGLADVLVFTE
jgi:hypothetical protein